MHNYMSDEASDEVAQHMNWNTIAEGLKPHESIYRVVVDGVPKTSTSQTLKSSNLSKNSITAWNPMLSLA